MGVIQTKAKSIDRDSLTFRMQGFGGSAFINAAKKVADDAITDSELTSEQSAAEKMGFLMKMISVLKAELLCKLARFEAICHATGIPTALSVPNATYTIIPFTTLIYRPNYGTYAAVSGYTVEKTGYYDVDVRFVNENLTTPVVVVYLSVFGGAYGITVDACTMGTEILRLQGSTKIYCEAGDSITAKLYQVSGGGILFNTLAHPGADGYISISYAASQNAATY